MSKTSVKTTVEWNPINWKQLERRVYKIQKRIYRASSRGDVKTVRGLQKVLMKSWSAKALATRRLTQDNQGKKTAGIDGIKSLSPKQRIDLISDQQSPDLLRVFVYGTLQPGKVNYQLYCVNKVIKTQKAFVIGKLFDLPVGYPAMTPGNELVHGYLLFFNDGEVLAALDELEDYYPHIPMSHNLYYRQKVEVFHNHGLSLGLAWAYYMLPQRVLELQGVHIPEGLWRGDNQD